jgi:hypothetical protein
MKLSLISNGCQQNKHRYCLFPKLCDCWCHQAAAVISITRNLAVVAVSYLTWF